MKITKSQLKRIIKEELSKTLHEWGDTRHQDMAMCDEKVPMEFGRNSPEYTRCLEHPEAYEPPDPAEHELYEAYDTGQGDKPTKKELEKRKELCGEKEGYEWVMPKKGDHTTVPWGSCKKKKGK